MLQKTSLLVERQLPGFISDDYPKFVTFLQKYYEFIEQSTYSETADFVGPVTGDNVFVTADKK